MRGSHKSSFKLALRCTFLVRTSLAAAGIASATDLSSHLADSGNPHGVTAAQAGAVPTGRLVSTTAPLAGGGALSGDLTLSLNTVPVSKGGTGLATISAGKLLYTDVLDSLAELSLGGSLAIVTGVLSVQDNTTIQQVRVGDNGVLAGTRREVNFIPGANVSLTVADNGASDRVDVTIAADSGVTQLDDLSDVTLTTPAASEILQHNGVGQFVNRSLSAAGIAPTSRAINTTGPLQGGGDLSADRTLSILQAGAAQDGYLSQVDWNAFNSKLSDITAESVFDLADVFGAPTDGQILAWVAANARFEPTSPAAPGAYQLDELSDVTLTAVAVDHILQANVSGVFENKTLAGAGIASATDLANHLADNGNPHGVTAAQAGAVPTGRLVSTTGPLQGGGDLSADRTLSILQAGAAQDGYLSQVDWNAFNNKAASGVNGNITSLVGLTTALAPQFGGTGQLGGYTKGALLVATGPSTLVKVPVGSNGQFLKADSGQPSGVAWASQSSQTRLIQVFNTNPSTTQTISGSTWTNVTGGAGTITINNAGEAALFNVCFGIEPAAGQALNTGNYRLRLSKSGSADVHLPSAGADIVTPNALNDVSHYSGTFLASGLAVGTWSVNLQISMDGVNTALVTPETHLSCSAVIA